MQHDGQPFEIGFLIFPGFPMSCLTSFIEPLRAANEIANKVCFSWCLLAEEEGKIQSSAEIDFEPSRLLSEASKSDYIIILSPPTAAFQDDRSLAILAKLHRHGATLGAISGGVFPLARLKLVTHLPMSVHWCYRAAFDAEFFDNNASENIIEAHDGVITASGAAAAFEVALQLIEEKLGENISTEVACWFQHPILRRSEVSQSVPIFYEGDDEGQEDLPEFVTRAILLFGRDLSSPITVGDVAEELNISARHLERSFKQATGLSPSHYFRRMRMEAARQIVIYTNDHMDDVALAVGYSSQQAFTKQYLTTYGRTPRADRKRINLTRVNTNSSVPSMRK